VTNDSAASECPPHHWEITLVRLETGLNDHYSCVRCGTEKDVQREQPTAWTRKPGGRPARARR
jgi:hypothetical protein